MNLSCRWEIVLISLWIQGFVPGIHCKDGTVAPLSKEDILLLKGVEDPKCFSRSQRDFTCFFETPDNRTYDFFYSIHKNKKRCELTVQRTEEGTFLHNCSFPGSDVFSYVDINLEVMERNTNTSLYNRTVHVEDNMLLDPPFNVSLRETDQVGQLEVFWQSELPKYTYNVMHTIRYSSKGLGQKRTKKEEETNAILNHLVPGEEVEVQVNIKSGIGNAGHWSSWSHPVRAMVPQIADDISLECYTSDLQMITCRWNGSRYGVENEHKLFYQMNLSEPLAWTKWTECLADRNLPDLCRFHGDGSRKVRVKLSSAPAPLSRTFYTQEFTLSNSIKTSPPNHLKEKSGEMETDETCLEWGAPLASLSAHLQYEISHQIRGEQQWKTVSIYGLKTGTCLNISPGSQYSVKVRAKPTGPIYSGKWSDWSEVLTGDTPTDRGIWLALFIPVLLLITAVILISLFPTYLSKLKLYFWPPVPNLDKVLHGYLTEIDRQKWNPALIAKQCSEETTSSVVEIMSEDEVSGLGKPSVESTQFLSPEGSFSSCEEADGSRGTPIFPDYVTLNRESVIVCQKGNNYVYKQVGEKDDLAAMDELSQTCHSCCPDGSVCNESCLSTDFLNRSYLLLAKPEDRFNCKVTAARESGNLYTNFPCS